MYSSTYIPPYPWLQSDSFPPPPTPQPFPVRIKSLKDPPPPTVLSDPSSTPYTNFQFSPSKPFVFLLLPFPTSLFLLSNLSPPPNPISITHGSPIFRFFCGNYSPFTPQLVQKPFCFAYLLPSIYF